MNEELALDQRNLTLVLHPGSRNFRFGRSTDCVPYSIPHCIARRSTSSSLLPKRQSYLARGLIDPTDPTFEAGLKAACEDLSKHRPLSSIEKLSRANAHVQLMPSEVVPPLQWTETAREFYTGEEALHLRPNANFHLSWPLRHGQLNQELTVTSALQDFEDIWTEAIESLLNIPKVSFQHYRCVLIIADIYSRFHVREMVNLLLSRMSFLSVLVHQENVCATFGIGLPTGCYVDVGDQKISISCVDDGISLPESRIVLDYGGADVTRVLHALLRRINFPRGDFSYSDNLDCALLSSAKEHYCHLETDQKDTRQMFLQRKRPQTSIFKLQLEVADELILAPFAFFHPSLFCLPGMPSTYMHNVSTVLESEPDDPFDDLYIVLTSRDRKKRDDGDNEGEEEDEDMADVPKQRSSLRPNKSQVSLSATDVQSTPLMPLDEAIVTSINRCDSIDMRVKMFGCVIIVGEGLRFEGAQDYLSSRLWNRVPLEYRKMVDSMDVIMSFKDLNPGDAAWKGASLITCVDSSAELWITKSEWLRFGSKILREKAPFVW